MTKSYNKTFKIPVRIIINSKKSMDFEDKDWKKDHPTAPSRELTEFDHKYGPAIALTTVGSCIAFLIWILFQ